jgi:hypothetical protein
VRTISSSLAALVVAVVTAQAPAAVITFEGFAPPGGLVNINPGNPYTEAGYTLTPTDANSAVFDANDTNAIMFGNHSSWFGFASDNTITLTNNASVPFNLTSLLLGPNNSTLPQTDITLVGHVHGGGTLTVTYSNLATATLESPNWSNLDNVIFNTDNSAGLDNITVTAAAAVPEPSMMVLSSFGGLGFVAIAALRRRIQKRKRAA